MELRLPLKQEREVSWSRGHKAHGGEALSRGPQGAEPQGVRSTAHGPPEAPSMHMDTVTVRGAGLKGEPCQGSKESRGK